MADISQVKLPNGDTYNLVDETSGYIKTFTETDPTVPAWAKAATKPTYTASEVGALPSSTVIPTSTSQLTNDSGYLTASDIASVMTYKGTKTNYAALPVSGNTIGDVWHLTDTGAEWAWDGSVWQELGTVIAGSDYEILIDPSSQVGIAQTGTAITTESNYTPQGTVLLNKSKTQLISSAVLNASWDNYVLRLSIGTEIREIDTVDSAEFEGADVNLIIRQRSD